QRRGTRRASCRRGGVQGGRARAPRGDAGGRRGASVDEGAVVSTTVAICRYGAGNVRSVELALHRLGAELIDDVEAADLAILPGVGSARTAMEGLRERGLDDVLRARAKPILGI